MALRQRHLVTEKSPNALHLPAASQTPLPGLQNAGACLILPQILLLLLSLIASLLVLISSPLLKAAWPRPLVTSCPELKEKVIFLLSDFVLYLAVFIYFLLLCFHFTNVDDSHCRSVDTFSWLPAPNSPAYRLTPCGFLQGALFSQPHPSSWPRPSSWFQPRDNSHRLCLLLFPRHSPCSSQTSPHLHFFCSHFFPHLFLNPFYFNFPCSLLYPHVVGRMPSLRSKAPIRSKGSGRESSELGVIKQRDRSHPTLCNDLSNHVKVQPPHCSTNKLFDLSNTFLPTSLA